jgi:RHS repeat-associated protein
VTKRLLLCSANRLAPVLLALVLASGGLCTDTHPWLAPRARVPHPRCTVPAEGRQDGESGLRDYDVQYKVGITGTWTSWLTNTPQTEAPFVGERDQSYYFRVQATDHVNNASAWVEAGPVTVSAVTKYYMFGDQRIAMRQGDVVYYLHSDHLGSTSLTTDQSGAPVAETRYLPYGEERWITGTLVTDFTFTGQRAERGFALMDYNARYYDPWLGRFVSADSIVPEPGNPQALDRYSYVLNRPLQGSDPTGHDGPDPGVVTLPPPTQWAPLALVLGKALTVVAPPIVAGAIAVTAVGGMTYGLATSEPWGPDYPLPTVVDPGASSIQPTWALPGTSTLTLDTTEVYLASKGTASMADHLGFLFGYGEAGLPGFPDPFDRHDRNKVNDPNTNAKHIRNSLRGIEENLEKNQTIRDYFRQNLTEAEYQGLTDALDNLVANFQEGFYEGMVDPKVGQEILDILARTGYIGP